MLLVKLVSPLRKAPNANSPNKVPKVSQTLVRRRKDRDDSRSFDSVLDSQSTGERLDLLDDVLVLAVDDVVDAERLGQLQPRGNDVDDDNG